MKNCPFCKPTQRILKENEFASVILSNPRKVPGHFLVIPKRHVEKPWNVTKDEIAGIFDLVFFVQRRISKELSDGSDVRQNYRPFLKQSKLKIDHIHYHVIPRTFEDTIYSKVEKYETDLFEDLTDFEHDQIATILEE